MIEAGESLSSIAHTSGHFWQKLWDHPANQELKEARQDPEILLPGDRLTVPPITPGWRRVATGRKYVFRRRGVPVKIAFTVKDQAGKPFSEKRYRLHVGEEIYEGTTDADGILEHWISPSAIQGRLEVELAEPAYPSTAVWELALGQMPPRDSIAGVQARLNNLDYACGPVDGAWGERCRAALARFQGDQDLEPTGEPDAATRDRLAALHGN